MQILREAAEEDLLDPLRTHGWAAAIGSENDSAEYIIITATKAAVSRKVALLYSSATDNHHYKTLDGIVDHIFFRGEPYHIESFAYGIKTPVTSVSEFFPLLMTWNKEIAPEIKNNAPTPRVRSIRWITAESPLDSVWARLNQFASIQLAEKLVRRRASEETVTLSDSAAKSKASGVAYALRNASDYFRSVPFESLNKRVLSLYYGVLAFAFAELLASPTGPADLDEVEKMTKQGHGLYTMRSETGSFEGLFVGVLATGFFPRWVSFLGHDISHYPRAKATTQSEAESLLPDRVTTIRDLLAELPELRDLFVEVFETPPAWLVPVFDREANSHPVGSHSSTYIRLIDRSKRIKEETISTAGWPIAEMTLLPEEEEGKVFRVRVDHAGRKFWHEALPIHRSPFEETGTLMLPILNGIFEYRVIAMVILYALSIMVRYMPSGWRRVEGGDSDQHLALVKTALGVFERLLPQEFLESIIGEQIITRQPGSFF